MSLEFSQSSSDLAIDANLLNQEYPECVYNPALCPPCSQRVFQPKHSPCLFGQFSARNPCIHTGCPIASRGWGRFILLLRTLAGQKTERLTSRRDDTFLELNNHFELPYQQPADDEPHIAGAFNLSTASESLKRAKSADQALLLGNHLTLFNDDTNINFSVFGNSSSQIALPWPEVDLFLQNPGTANDILAGLPCSHISRQLLSRWQ